MGYMTNYRFKTCKTDENVKAIDIVKAIREMQSENKNIFYPFEHDLVEVETKENYANYHFLEMEIDHAKWYEHDLDMTELSLKFPNIIFKLHGEGEEREDVWDCYYQNGKKKLYEAKLVMPKFNIEDLK